MIVLLNFARFTKEKMLFWLLLGGILIFQCGLVPEKVLDSVGFSSVLMAQEEDAEEAELEDGAEDADDDWGDEDEDFGDEEAADGADEDAESEDEEFGDEESEDEEFGDEESEDEESEDEESEDGESEDESEDSGVSSRAKGQKVEISDILEQYESDLLYSMKKYQYGDASIRQILSTNPQTVMELVAAARDFTTLQRYELANHFYARALDVPPSDEDVTELVTEYGRAFFVLLAENQSLAPDGNAFAQYILDELAARFESNEEFIQEMIGQLFSSDEKERKVAVTELMMYRDEALPRLIEEYQKRKSAAERKVLDDVLLQFGDDLTGALAAGINSGIEGFQLTCVELLQMQTARKNPYSLSMLFYAAGADVENGEKIREYALKMLNSLISKGELTKPRLGGLLQDQILRLQEKKNVIEKRGDDDSEVKIWFWDEESETLVPRLGNLLQRYRLDSYRLAKAFWNLYPQNAQAKKFLFMTTSERISTFTEFTPEELRTNQIIATEEFQEIKKHFTLDEIEALLEECLSSSFYDAAILAVLELGESGTEAILQPSSIRKGQILNPTLLADNSASYAPLVRALYAPHRLLRFAALQSIMKLNPQKPYPGSSRVVDTLGWFLQTEGRAKVLVGDLTSADATFLGARFYQYGLNFEVATTTQELIQKAQKYCDYSIILLNVQLLSQNSDMLLQQLAQDSKTADIPIVLMAHPENFKLAELTAKRIPKCIWFPFPSHNEDFALLRKLIARIQTSVNIPNEQRIAETKIVLKWTSEILRSHQGGWVQKMRFGADKDEYLAPDKALDFLALNPQADRRKMSLPSTVPSILEDVPEETDVEGSAEGTVDGAEVKAGEAEAESAEAKDESVKAEELEESGDAELDQLLAEGRELTKKKAETEKKLEEEKEAETAAEAAKANPAAEWDREPLQIYDVSKLVTPVLTIYHYPDFFNESMEVLRWVGTQEAQQVLLSVGGSGMFDYEESKKVLRLYRENVLRFGVLMNADQVGSYYDQYNSTPAEFDLLLSDMQESINLLDQTAFYGKKKSKKNQEWNEYLAKQLGEIETHVDALRKLLNQMELPKAVAEMQLLKATLKELRDESVKKGKSIERTVDEIAKALAVLERQVKTLDLRGSVLDALEAPLDPKSMPDLTLDEKEESVEKGVPQKEEETDDEESAEEEEFDDEVSEDEELEEDEEFSDEDLEEDESMDEELDEDLEEDLEEDEELSDEDLDEDESMDEELDEDLEKGLGEDGAMDENAAQEDLNDEEPEDEAAEDAASKKADSQDGEPVEDGEENAAGEDPDAAPEGEETPDAPAPKAPEADGDPAEEPTDEDLDVFDEALDSDIELE